MSLAILGLATGLALSLSGCDQANDTTTDPAPAVTDDGGQSDSGHSHGETRSLGEVTVGGVTLQVTIGTPIHPGGDVSLEIEQTAGEAPAAIRIWMGERDGTDSIKGKADGSDGHYHAHIEAPGAITSTTRLWIEVENANGDRDSVGIPVR
jgi:hypothetical protein